MARLITGQHLTNALDKGGFIEHGSLACVEGAKYDFRMSPIILKALYGTPVDLDKLPEQERAQICVEPGEVVFVRTIEHLNLPNDTIAVLSSKRKLSHQGIIVLGGFCIDPKYHGPLFIGLYNFSSTPFPIQPGRKLIAAIFYKLSGQEQTEFPVPESVSEGEFPEELVTLIRNYKPIELSGLTEAIADTQRRLEALAAELRDDKSWKRDFQEALDRQGKEIDKLLDGLKEERAARKEEDAAIKSKLDGMSSLFTGVKLGWVVAWTIIALFLGALITHFVPKLFADPPPPPTAQLPKSQP